MMLLFQDIELCIRLSVPTADLIPRYQDAIRVDNQIQAIKDSIRQIVPDYEF